eukprot:TRINITY_DN4366_c0_g1_i6.p1 TRINITY_DN4366_c0_g1~~TRINITY_DN4366_c0_g1_i6.p1  ORF type:complete len:158 (+),score=24.32 TRINITY_DN4366_c0_g1_i6:418-891(+)
MAKTSFTVIKRQITSTKMEKAANVVLDIDSLIPSSEKCPGSPKMKKALSRKGSSRMERRSGEELESDEASKKVVVKVTSSQMEILKQGSTSNKTLLPVAATTNCSTQSDGCDGRNKRFNRFGAIHPRKILLIFASLSSMGTIILIYFTLAITRTSGA